MAQQVVPSPIHQLSPPQALRRLREWQQQQQQELLLQQQRELLALKSERTRQGVRSHAQPSLSQSTVHSSSVRKTKLANHGNTRLSHSGHHQQSHNVALPPSLNSVSDKSATRRSPSKVSPSASPPSDGTVPKCSPSGSSPRMVTGSLQPPGHTASGSSLTSTRSADSGMLSGQESISTAGQGSEDPLDHSSGFLTPSSDLPSDGEMDSVTNTATIQPACSSGGCVPLSHDELPIRPGIVPGCVSTFEELIDKKLKENPPPSSLPAAPLSQGHSLFRCPSDDSFFIRKEQRSKEEERELAEFEMLERAALESSFSSQCSLITRLLGTSEGNLASSPKPAESVSHLRRSPLLPTHALRGQQAVVATSKTIRERSPSLTPVLEDGSPQEEDETHFQSSSTPVCSKPKVLQLTSPAYTCPNRTGSSRKPVSGQGTVSDEQRDLDSTLKPPSPTAAGDFSDEEAWESSTCETPIRPMALSHSSSSSLSSSCSSKQTSPSRTIATPQHHPPVQPPPLPVRKVKVLPGSPLVVQQPTNQPSVQTYQPLKTDASSFVPNSVLLPPPSALVDKLFPSLKKGRLPRQPASAVKEPPQGHVQSRGTMAMSSTAVHGSAGDGDKGFGEHVRQVREKLVQLENEIEWYKSRNAALEKLRVEREKALLQLKTELAEFEKQKETELAGIEQYRQETTKKLKTERKVFENYQREVRNSWNKKIREEIEALKAENSELCESLRQKEARWSSVLSRYRLRIESLEAQNKELQTDLRVMERERLLWWQQQQSELKKVKEAATIRKSASPHDRSIRTSPSLVGTTTSPKMSDSHATSPIKPLHEVPVKKSLRQQRGNSPPIAKPPRILSGNQMTVYGDDKENAVPCSVSSVVTRSQNSCQRGGNVLCRNGSQPLLSFAGEGIGECEIIDVLAMDKRGGQDDGTDSDLSTIARRIASYEIYGDEGELEEEDNGSNPMVERKHVRFGSMSDTTDGSSPEPFSVATIEFSPSPSPQPPSLPPHALKELSPTCSSVGLRSTKVSENKLTEIVEEDGTRVTLFPNGTKKIVSADSNTSTFYFFNGDIKRRHSDGSEVYHYSKCKTTHQTLPDGTEIFEFANNQREKHHPNGTKEINYPNGAVRTIYPSGEEKAVMADGTVQVLAANGDKTIQFPDGQKEVHTKLFKRREYPDGMTRTVYPDGHQETHYASGRVKIKDKDGRVVSDTMTAPSSN